MSTDTDIVGRPTEALSETAPAEVPWLDELLAAGGNPRNAAQGPAPAIRGVLRRSNDRCDQENLIQQQKNGVRALTAPLDNLQSIEA